MSQIVSPHDRFFKQAMSNINVAREFLEFHLPPDIKKEVDLNNLGLQNESFIDSELKLSMSDVLYATSFHGKPGYIYTLVEAQSTPCELMPFRILKYTLSIIDRHLKQFNTKELPLVYAMVFYNGDKPYTYSTDIKDLIQGPRELIEKYWLKPFQLIDLNSMNDDEIKKHYWRGIMEFSLKNARARDILNLISELKDFLKFIDNQGGSDFIISFFTYIVTVGETKEQEKVIKAIANALTKETGDKIMTLAEQLIQKGEVKGRAEGEALMLMRLLKLKFGELTEKEIKHIEKADAETLLSWAEKVLSANKIEDIFK